MEVAAGQAPVPARAVLLVDDSIRARAPVADLLRTNGYQVLEAATSDDALELLNSRLEIKVLIAVAQMKGSMGGLALADWVLRTRSAIRVVVISDQGQTPDVPHKGIAFVTRPFASADLLAMLPPVAPGP